MRHALKNHGNAKYESERGQIPITDAEIAQIPEIVSNPDAYILGAKSKIGRDLIGYVKVLGDGTTLYIEENRTGKNRLAMVSIRKYPAAKNASEAIQTVLLNVRDDSGNVRIVYPDSHDGQLQFSRAQIVGQTNRQYTPEQLQAMANVGFQVEVPTLKERAAPSDGAVFSTRTSAPEKQLALQQIERLVQSALRGLKNAPTVRVVASPEAIGLRTPVETVPSGVTLASGDIYVVQSGVGSALDVDMVAVHKLFQKGQRGAGSRLSIRPPSRVVLELLAATSAPSALLDRRLRFARQLRDFRL